MLPRRAGPALLLVVGAALAAFATALHGSFVNWDDEWLILRNPYLRGFRHLGDILDPISDRLLLGAEYLPVRDLSNVLDFQIFGTEPTGYRLGNWLLHALSAGLAYAFLREALRRPGAAAAGALLWALHPLHAEVVAWASARKDLLNAVFALLAGTLYLRAGRTGSRGLALAAAGAFLLATLSKTSAAALPAMLAMVEALTGDPATPFGRRLRGALLRAAPMLAVAAAGAGLNAWHQRLGNVRTEWRGGSWPANFLIMAGVHLRYLRQTLLPFGLGADYALDERHPLSAVNLAGAAALLAALGGTAWLCRRRPAEGWCALWWFLLLAPASNVLFPISNASADRYLLLPSLGACALAGLLLDRAAAAGPRAAKAATAALAAAVLCLGLAAAAQARVWRDGLALWSHAVEISPRCGRAWLNYGEAFVFAGRTEEGLSAFARMLDVDADNPSAWVHAGSRLAELGGPGRRDEAERLLRTGVEKAEPGSGVPHLALAQLLNREGRIEESVRLLEEAARRQPSLAAAHLNLGRWHQSMGRNEDARRELEEALRLVLPIQDQVEAHDRLFHIYESAGDAERARFHRERRETKKALTWGE
jgi:tetratricopeptide (TPR) repeat protein